MWMMWVILELMFKLLVDYPMKNVIYKVKNLSQSKKNKI